MFINGENINYINNSDKINMEIILYCKSEGVCLSELRRQSKYKKNNTSRSFKKSYIVIKNIFKR
ncbi:hypothetical protein ABFP60_12945 [Clostridioides difficile]